MKHMKLTTLTASDIGENFILTSIKGHIFKFPLQITHLKVKIIYTEIDYNILAIIQQS